MAAPSYSLRALGLDDAEALLAVVDADRETFDRWLRWSAGIRTVEAARDFIGQALEREAAGRGFHWGIWRDERLRGGVICWSIDSLASDARGGGIATEATRAAVDHLITQHQVNRVEFQCRVENLASRQVAERAGGQLEGIRRQSHWVAGAFRDHAVYAVLAGEWR
jgi:ribosomal-protein-serine acetyltransferase